MMKKMILGLAMMMTLAGAFAKDSTKTRKSPEEQASLRADRLKTELGLSDEQRAQVHAAVTEKIRETRAIKDRYRDSARKKGMGAEIKSVNERFHAKMNAILTPEQKQKYQAMRKKGKEDYDDDDSDNNGSGRKEKKKQKTGKGKPSK